MKSGYAKKRREAKIDLWEAKYFLKGEKRLMKKQAKKDLRRARRRAEKKGEEPK